MRIPLVVLFLTLIFPLRGASHRAVLHFEPNRGQFAAPGSFVAQGKDFGIALAKDAVVLGAPGGRATVTFLGANPAAQLAGQQQQPGVSNYFRGNDPAAWLHAVPNYGTVHYTALYPGINAVFYSRRQEALEFDLIVSPGADPALIRLRVPGAALDPQGNLTLPNGLRLNRPTVYQNIAGQRKPVAGSFARSAPDEFRFRIAPYDRSHPLIVDPAIPMLYSTLLGGDHDDESTGIALDAAGNSYIVGYSSSNVFPVTASAFEPQNGRLPDNTAGQVTNAVVAKFNPSGTLLYSTYLGGNDADEGQAITVDSAGNAYVFGLASSPNFPLTANAYQSTISGEEAFLSELSPDGSALEYSSFFGTGGMPYLGIHGSMIGAGAGLTLDAQGRVYITGTAYAGMPTSQTAYMAGLPNNYLGFAGYVALLDLTQLPAYQLVASTYFTTPSPAKNSRYYGSYSYTVTLDNQGNPWIGGEDLTGALPTTANAYQASVSVSADACTLSAGPLGSAAYLAEFTPDLSTLEYASYLSGQTVLNGADGCSEWIQGLTADRSGNLYAAGVTASTTFPVTSGALQYAYPGPNQSNAEPVSFVAKLTSGTSLAWATYLGQNAGATEIFSQPFLDSSGNIWVAGETTTPGNNFPLSANALTGQGGVQTAFITGIDNSGSTAVFSSFLSGSLYPTLASGVALDSYGNIYIAGTTTAPNFPTTPGAYQTVLNLGLTNGSGFADWFFTILGGGSLSVLSPPSAGNAGSVTLTLSGSGFQPGATCSLTLNGTTYTSESASIGTGGTSMTCVMELAGAAPGGYTLTVNNPAGSITLPSPFTVEAAAGPHVWSDTVGHPISRVAEPSDFYVTYGNSGDTDAYFSILWMAFPSTYTYSLAGLQTPSSITTNYSQYPSTFSLGGMTYLPVMLPYLPAGSSGSFQLILTIPTAVAPIGLVGYVDPPWFSSLAAAQTALAAVPSPLAAFCAAPATYAVANCLSPLVYYFTAAAEGAAANEGVTVTPAALANWQQQLMQNLASLAQSNQLPDDGVNGVSAFPVNNAVPQPRFLNSTDFDFVKPPGDPNIAIYNTPDSHDQDPCLQATYQLYGLRADARDLDYVDITMESSYFLWQENIVPDAFARVGFGLAAEQFCNDFKTGQSYDPNFKAGPWGDDSSNQYINGQSPLRYNVGFENQASASLPAQQVVVTDQLDATKVNLSTFTPLAVAFGSQLISLSGNASTFNTTVPLNSTLSLSIQGGVNPVTGLAKWTFTSIDPTTRLPPTDPTVGFLPPDADGVEGQGSVLFTVMPKSGLATGTVFQNQATVFFDANAPIVTPTWTNTLDVNPPVSSVQALPPQETQASFTVTWSGTDQGSGIAGYNIFVSINGGPFAIWQNQTTSTSAVFQGQGENSYAFYSIAIDGAGNLEAPKTAAETATADIAPNLCDVNNVGNVTIGDLQSLINQALGAGSPAGDLNGDGVVNVADVAIDLNAVLGGTCLSSQ